VSRKLVEIMVFFALIQGLMLCLKHDRLNLIQDEALLLKTYWFSSYNAGFLPSL